MSKKKKLKKWLAKQSFEPGTLVVFDQKNFSEEWWNQQKEKDLIKWYGPLGYKQKKKKLFVFICEILEIDGIPSEHCVLAELNNKIVTMRHTSDFRKATDDEV